MKKVKEDAILLGLLYSTGRELLTTLNIKLVVLKEFVLVKRHKTEKLVVCSLTHLRF